MASQREQQQEETHFRVMRLLDEDPSISTREIARRVGISNGAAYYCVTALIEKGFVKLRNFARSKTKGNYIYELTPRGIRVKAALTVSFLERKKHEYEDLKLEIQRLESELGVEEDNEPTNSETRCELFKNLTCFKAYDIRGKLDEELDKDIAYKIGRATVESLNSKTVAVGLMPGRRRPIWLMLCQMAFAMLALTSWT